MTQPIVVLDHGLCVSTANNAFLRTFKVERDDVLGKAFFNLGNGQWDIPELRQLNAKVIPRAQAVVGFEVKHDFPDLGQRTFLVDARRLVHPDHNSTSILVLFDDVTDRQRRDAEKDFIVAETRHRMRNLFAVVRTLAMQMKVDGLTAAEYRDRFLGRLEGTLRAQEIAATSEATDLETLVSQSVGDTVSARLVSEGPLVMVEAARIAPISMIFHELATNSLKYGALSASEGRVRATWSLDTTSTVNAVRCEWREENGPPVSPPQHKGFGTALIKRMATHLGGGAELHYNPHGLTAEITFSCEAP